MPRSICILVFACRKALSTHLLHRSMRTHQIYKLFFVPLIDTTHVDYILFIHLHPHTVCAIVSTPFLKLENSLKWLNWICYENGCWSNFLLMTKARTKISVTRMYETIDDAVAAAANTHVLCLHYKLSINLWECCFWIKRAIFFHF